MVVAMAVIAILLLVSSLNSVQGADFPPYDFRTSQFGCWEDIDHNKDTLQKINCKKNPAAKTIEGCMAICSPDPDCYGLVFIPYKAQWVSSKYCCYLKTEIKARGLEVQYARTTCKWDPTGDAVDMKP